MRKIQREADAYMPVAAQQNAKEINVLSLDNGKNEEGYVDFFTYDYVKNMKKGCRYSAEVERLYSDAWGSSLAVHFTELSKAALEKQRPKSRTARRKVVGRTEHFVATFRDGDLRIQTKGFDISNPNFMMLDFSILKLELDDLFKQIITKDFYQAYVFSLFSEDELIEQALRMRDNAKRVKEAVISEYIDNHVEKGGKCA